MFPKSGKTFWKRIKQKEETEKQLEKTQTIQKTKIVVSGAFKKKNRNGNVFLEVLEIFQISANGC